MKKLLLTAALFTAICSQAQLVVSPNPFGVSSGTITITYGSNDDYTLFDPAFATTIYLYTGLETDGVADTWDYHDTWDDVTTLIPLTYDETAHAYVGTANIGTRNYIEETTGNSATLPADMFVNNWFFIIRNAEGNSQSANLVGTDYGFVPESLSTSNFNAAATHFAISHDEFQTNISGKSTFRIYSLNGQKVKEIRFENTSGIHQETIGLQQRGIFIAEIENDGKKISRKFAR